MLSFLWNHYLYEPLFNLLVWLYTGMADFNLGVAIIILTVLLRIILLPLTILSERGRKVSRELSEDVGKIKQDFANDPVRQKLAVRLLLKEKKVRHWAKAIVLGVQGLILLLLYQVFVAGIAPVYQFSVLYPWVPRPDFIDTVFLGIDIGAKGFLLPFLAGGYLFAQIVIKHYFNKTQVTRKELIYVILFPGATFLVLILLPSLKALFILTSLVISSIISMITYMIRVARKKNQPVKSVVTPAKNS